MNGSTIIPDGKRMGFLLHSDTEKFKRKLEKTEKEIVKILNVTEKPYVAYSGGKDSCVMLHLVSELHPFVNVFHWDYGPALLPRNIENEILNNMKKISPNGNFVIKQRPHGDEERARHGHISSSGFFEELNDLIDQKEWDLCFLGLRKGESSRRNIRILSSQKNWMNLERGGKIPIYFPLRDWSAKDIFGYAVSKSIPIPSVYRTLAQINNGDWESTRLSTFFDEEFANFGSIETSSVFFWENKHKVE